MGMCRWVRVVVALAGRCGWWCAGPLVWAADAAWARAVGDRQMHPRFPVVAQEHGHRLARTVEGQRAAWSWEVLKVHQCWRHR